MASDMPPTDQQKSPPARRPFFWRRVLLVVSLAFNLLIIGAIAGTLLGDGDRKGPRGPRDNPLLNGLGYGPYVGALTREDKRAMTEALKDEAGSFRERRRELRREFEIILDVLRADDLDEEELRNAIARQRARVAELQELGSILLLERIVAMSPEERIEYADRLDKQVRHRGPDPRKDGERK